GDVEVSGHFEHVAGPGRVAEIGCRATARGKGVAVGRLADVEAVGGPGPHGQRLAAGIVDAALQYERARAAESEVRAGVADAVAGRAVATARTRADVEDAGAE